MFDLLLYVNIINECIVWNKGKCYYLYYMYVCILVYNCIVLFNYIFGFYKVYN